MTVEGVTGQDSAGAERRGGCWLRLLVGFGCCVPAYLAAEWVGRQAPDVHPLDLFFGATLQVVAVWLLLPVVVVATWRLGRRWVLLAAGLVVTVALVVTLWIMRPTAPIGSDYDIGVATGELTLERELVAALDTAVPGRWESRGDERVPCADRFGRDRGAARHLLSFEVHGGISLDDQSALASVFEQQGWHVGYEDVTFGSGPGRRLNVERDGYTVTHLGTHLGGYRNQPENLTASTPCLRAD